jgi:23S rRNA (uracil1939-C5)-methyltransferase
MWMRRKRPSERIAWNPGRRGCGPRRRPASADATPLMKKPTPTTASTYELEIEKLVYGGWGLGRHQGKVVFVPFTVPGDRVEVRTELEKKTYLRAAPVRIIKQGPGRQDPPCPYFGRCGGCQWQQLEYPRQVETKRQILEALFSHRFPGSGEVLDRVRGCPFPYRYRSRARLHLQSGQGALKAGFFRHQSRDVEDIAACPLLRPALNDALAHIRKLMLERPAPFRPAQVDLASSEEEGRWAFEETASIPCAGAPRRARPGTRLLKKVGMFQYWVTPSVFFQANDFMVAELADVVMDLIPASGGGSALELFAGVGLFSLPLARRFEQVVAVEADGAASRLCRENALQASIGNLRAICGEAGAWMDAAATVSPPAYDLVLLDPPRSGAGADVMRRLAQWTPETIVYVSCDPQTLVRDLAVIPRGTYRIDHLEGLDLFPQTYHFETVVRLCKV